MDRNQCDGLVENEGPGADVPETSQRNALQGERESVCVCVVYVARSLENFILKKIHIGTRVYPSGPTRGNTKMRERRKNRGKLGKL